MKETPELLSSPEQIQELSRKLEQADMIAFDTEFIREQTFFPQVELIQIATIDEVWLVDARAFLKRGRQEAIRELSPLLDILRSPRILKVAHAIQGDQECLYTAFGVTAAPSIDTAIAASLCGYGESLGLGNLLKSVLGVTIKKGHARTNWAVRPLPLQLLEYAAADVRYLVRAAQELIRSLDELKRREWAIDLSRQFETPSLYEPDPEGIANRLGKGGRFDKSTFSVLLHLVRWRENRVRELNVPRKWLADDQVLIDLARVKPKDLEHLKTFRGLNKGEARKNGETLLKIIEEAKGAEAVSPPKTKRIEPPSVQEAQVLDLLKCYLRILSDEHRIAQKYLATTSQLLPMLRLLPQSPQEFVDQGILSKSAAELVGQEIIDFLNGRRVLSVEGTVVRIVEVPKEGPRETSGPQKD